MPFDDHTHNNDWVIFKLDYPLEINSNVQPACLPPTSEYLSTSSTEKECYTSGWGSLKYGTQVNSALKIQQIHLVKFEGFEISKIMISGWKLISANANIKELQNKYFMQ